MDPRQWRPEGRRLRHAGDLRARGLYGGEAQGQRPVAREPRQGALLNPHRICRSGARRGASARDRGREAMSGIAKPRIAVVGSNMVDLVTYVNRMPVKG